MLKARPCAPRAADGVGQGHGQSGRAERHEAKQGEEPARGNFHSARRLIRPDDAQIRRQVRSHDLRRAGSGSRSASSAAIIFAALVWFAGPIISIGDAQPFESVWLRLVIILVIWLIVVASIAWRDHQPPPRRRGARKGDDRAGRGRERRARSSAEKMQDALATLKTQRQVERRARSTICRGI